MKKGTFKVEVIKTLGLSNLRKQFEKIDHLLHDTMYKEILFEIMMSLDSFDLEHDRGNEHEPIELSDCDIIVSTKSMNNTKETRFLYAAVCLSLVYF